MNSQQPSPANVAEILIVEDSATQAEQLRYLLEHQGYRTVVAENGRAALGYMAEHQPTLIVSDIIMPEMDGYALCRHIRQDERLKNIPVILLTALSDPRDVFRGLECGADNFVTKPYSEDNLLSRIRYILINRELRGKRTVELGTEIAFKGEHYLITSERQQILDLLLSTYETAVERNLELITARDELRDLNATLEERVRKRTAELEAEVCRRKEIEQQLHRREQEFRALAERSPDVVARFDRDLKYLYINPAIEKSTGAKPEFFIGKPLPQLGLPEATERLWVNHLCSVFESGRESAMEFSYRLPDGGEAFFDTRLVPEFAQDGEVSSVIGVSRDITERQRVKMELSQANEELARALNELRATQRRIVQSEKLAALGTLAAGVAHELNNPLMGVFNYVDYARQHVTDPELQYPLDRASEELRRIRDLLKGMLAFARPSGEERTAVDLNGVLARTIELLAAEFRAQQITFTSELPERLPRVTGNESQLQQVFLNILLNARDAVETSANKRVSLRAFAADSVVAVEVADEGEGIPEAIQGRIFDPFFTTKPPGKGTGLGLSIVQGVLLDLKGSIDFVSRPGAGTIFTVTLPKAPDTL